MTRADPTVDHSEAAGEEPTEASFTAERIEQLLRDAVQGAQELDENLRRVFDLSEANASLRLR